MVPRILKTFAILKRNQDAKNQTKPFPTVKQLTKAISGPGLDVLSESSMRRVLDMMRDALNLPIDYIPERGGMGFTEPVAGFALDAVSEE